MTASEAPKNCILLTSIYWLIKCNFLEPQKQSLEVFYKTGVLKNFAKFAGKQLSESSFNKVAGLRPAILLKKRLATGLSL